MRNKIPADAFEYYRTLGPARTYAAVATHYGVSVRGVTKRAVKEDWQGRLARIEADARRKQDDKAVEDVAAVDDKHLRMARAIQARALETLKNSPLGNGASAVKALDVAIKIERTILGRTGKDTAPAMSHAAIVELSNKIPKHIVDMALAAMAEADAAKAPAPVIPPVLVPRLYGEN